MKALIAFVASLGVLTLAAAAVAQTPAAPAPAASSAAAPVLAPTPTIVDPSYKLGPADKLHITTFGEPDLTGDFTVGATGAVALPLVGDIQASGTTVDQFRDRFVTALKDGYLLDPKVSIEVLTYRPYYVLGEVNHPDEFPYSSNLTVVKAVAAAGGFTYRANTTKVFIKHQNDAAEKEYPLTPDLAVEPGDTLRIAERYF